MVKLSLPLLDAIAIVTVSALPVRAVHQGTTLRALALANQKGGVGKTTTAIHLAHCFALAGLRVVLVDLDPQGNATLALQSALSAERGGSPLLSAGPNFSLLPAPTTDTPDLAGLERLRSKLETETDVLLVDCPPRMDAWGRAGVSLCDQVLVPVQAEFFAMHGLSRMIETVAQAGRDPMDPGALLGVVLSMFDHREPIAHEVRADLHANLGSLLLDSVIVRDAQFIEAASHGVSLLDYNPLAKGARCYVLLAREIMALWATVPRETGR